jgi:PAS domain S-box-containing protein
LTIPPDRLEEARDTISKAQQGQSTRRRETVRIRKDGTGRFVSLSIAAVKDADGKPVAVAAIAHDITPVKLAEAARLETEDRFKLAQEAAGIGIWDWSLPSSNATCSEQYYSASRLRKRGRRRSELHWRATREDGTPISSDEIPSMFALRTGSQVHDVVLRIWNARTQEPHWVSIDAIPRFRAGETKPYEVQVICHDLTAQIEAAARLHASEERSRLLIEHGMEVIGVIDPAATILYVSPSVERVFGYPPNLLIGTNAMEYLHPDDWPAVQEFIHGILHAPSSAAVTLHIRLRHRDGEWRSVESAAANCLHVEALRGIVVNLRDITE